MRRTSTGSGAVQGTQGFTEAFSTRIVLLFALLGYL
jgi:hypothetical protein